MLIILILFIIIYPFLNKNNKIFYNKKEEVIKAYKNRYENVDNNVISFMAKQVRNKKEELKNLNNFEFLGSKGELNIFEDLKFLEKEPLFLFNIYIPINENKFTEIDVIMLHPSGIYVFESKNMKGWIFGNENDKYWTQCLKISRRETKKFKFINPIQQNKKHIDNLSKYLEYKTIPIYNYIIFGTNSSFKRILIESDNINICYSFNLFKNIIMNKHFKENNLTTEQICKIYNKLYPLTLRTEEFKKKHIERIKKETY